MFPIMVEEWVKPVNFNRYLVSNLGNIFSLHMQKQMSKYTRGMYSRISLLDDNSNKKQMLVHRLVALAFISNPEDKATVNHIDHNPNNNAVCNLEWSTAFEQNTHRRKCTKRLKKVMLVQYDEDWFPIAAHITGKDGYLISKKAQIKTPRGIVLSGTTTKEGYKTVHLNNRHHYVHVLMAKVFLDIPSDTKYVINHKDGNKSNAFIDNLEWCTASQNAQHAIENNLIRSCIKVHVTNTVSGEKQRYHSMKSTCRILRTSSQTIKKCAHSGVLLRRMFNVQFFDI